jgi:hypothetical protein
MSDTPFASDDALWGACQSIGSPIPWSNERQERVAAVGETLTWVRSAGREERRRS